MSSIAGLNELEDLRLFLEERAQAFDETIDTEVGSAFDIAVIQPVIQRLGPDPYNTPIRDFVLERLIKEFPDLVVQDGEPIDDTVIKPTQVLLEPYRRQIRQISTNQSLANPAVLNEREADNLGANFFARRQLGGFSVGIARLFYSAPQFALITPSNPVFTAEGLRFFPVENQAITADRMLFNTEDNLFFFDIVVRAESQGSNFNIDPNLLVGIEGVPAVVKVVNKREFEEGDDKESTEAFIERVENSLTEKSLVTVRGINARLTDVFEQIRLIQVIGFGDPEMSRDIITGTSQSQDYAWFTATTPSTGGSGTPQIDLDLSGSGFIVNGNPAHDDFVAIGIQVGDIITFIDRSLQLTAEFTVTDVVGGTELRVTPNITDNLAQSFFSVRRADGLIAISDIPGGILNPTTPAGEIEIKDGEIHIGGALDVFVRAGEPQERDITLEGILDGNPLHFGLELESFGDGIDERVHITESMLAQAAIATEDRFGNTLTTNDEIIIRQLDEVTNDGPTTQGLDFNPWVPTEEDVGRFVQFLGPTEWGTFEITEFLNEEYFEDSGTVKHRSVRIRLDVTTDLESGAAPTPFTPTTDFVANVRLLEEVSVKNRVRDRDGTTEAIAADDPDPGDPLIPGGIDFDGLGAEIGDSVVIETGDDAGIYSIRRILSWLNDSDTLILDRDLTKTVTPSGTGGGTGLRYRIADELNVDLIAPKVVKIPLGTLFAGDDLSSVAGSPIVSATGTTNFLLAGVEEGDTLEILEGDNAGQFGIIGVTGTTLNLDASPTNTTTGQTFSVYRAFSGVDRPLVRVKEVELLDSNSQPTGIQIPYGDTIDARTVGVLANRAQGNIVERFTGELEDNGAGLVDLEDTNVDFVEEGVEIGQRLNILSGNSVGEYTIIAVGTGDSLPSNNHIRVAAVADGGIAFRTAQTSVHYSIGEPSSGFIRLFFLEPTTVEIQTGLNGGRLSFEPETTPREFRFSEVSGFPMVPAGGSEEDNPRDIRVVRNKVIPFLSPPGSPGSTAGGTGVFTDATPANFITNGVKTTQFLRVTSGANAGDYDIQSIDSETQLTVTPNLPGADGAMSYEIVEFNTIVELTDPTRPGVFELEIQEGDVIEVNEQLPFLETGGSTFDEIGVMGTPAGLRTIAGSSLVSVPANSLIDFTAMDTAFPLAGQKLFIDSGPDAGEYTIEEVVSAKSLRLDRVLVGTTESILASDLDTPRTGVLEDNTAKTKLVEDATDATNMLFGAQQGHFITLFESTRADIDGTFEISDLLTSEPLKLEIDTNDEFVDEGSTEPLLDPFSQGLFAWVRTAADVLVEQRFRIYKEIPTEFEVIEVATKRDDVISSVRRGDITASTTLFDTTLNNHDNAKRGDFLEILAGAARGVYTLISDAAANVATIHANPSFPVTVSDVPYRIWGGLHGSRRMLTLGPKDSSSGRMEPGELLPYRILRPKIVRVSSTEMQDNEENSLFFVDVQIESMGAGDELNFAADTRAVVDSGLKADGYTYSTENESLSYSMFEEVSLNFDRRFLPLGNSDSPENLTEVSGRNLSVVYGTSTTVRLVNDLMRSDRDRPINASPIARHFLPSFLFINMNYAGGPTEEEAGTDIEDFVNSLGAEDEINISDLEAILVRRGATFIRHPISLVTVTHDLGRKLVVNRSDNKLGGLNSVPFNGTGRISAFFTKLDESLILVRES
jgi:hypothetical protein